MAQHEKAGPLTPAEEKEMERLQKKLERDGKVLPPEDTKGKHSK